MRHKLRARHWSQFDMHHLLWEPALAPRRFFELYCETWRRSVLNLKGRKHVWAWLREVDARNALFLLRALRRTQRLMDPAHYLAEYDLTPCGAPSAGDRKGAGIDRSVRHDVVGRHQLRVTVGERHPHRREQERRSIHP